MCLIAWRWLPDAPTPLVWAANRDEFAHRATGALQRWAAHEQSILSGVDLALAPLNTGAGKVYGTWAGINSAGKFAWLTNIRQPQHANPEAPSRGLLVAQYLSGDASAQAYLATVKAKAHRYNGFNLVLGQISPSMTPSSISPSTTSSTTSSISAAMPPSSSPHKPRVNAICLHYNSATDTAQALPAGVYGLSNADLDTPWPKTRALVQAVSLSAAAQHGETMNTDALFAALANPQRCTGSELPSTGVPLDIEHVLSSAFIAANLRGNDYGTRSSTVGWVHTADCPASPLRVHIQERSFDAQGLCNNTVYERLDLTI
jgi:uncharacterized protein with NRDE domain